MFITSSVSAVSPCAFHASSALAMASLTLLSARATCATRDDAAAWRRGAATEARRATTAVVVVAVMENMFVWCVLVVVLVRHACAEVTSDVR